MGEGEHNVTDLHSRRPSAPKPGSSGSRTRVRTLLYSFVLPAPVGACIDLEAVKQEAATSQTAWAPRSHTSCVTLTLMALLWVFWKTSVSPLSSFTWEQWVGSQCTAVRNGVALTTEQRFSLHNFPDPKTSLWECNWEDKGKFSSPKISLESMPESLLLATVPKTFY